jgi:hypothetical protein
MRVAHERKRAMIDTLLDAAARAAALRELQAGELAWLHELVAAVEGARDVLGAVAAAVGAREAAYAAAGAAAAAAAARSSVAPDDVYLTRLQQLLAPGSADWAAARAGALDGPAASGGGGGRAHGAPLLTPQQRRLAGGAGGDSFTPRGGGAPRGTPGGAGGFCSARDLAGRLSGLAGALRSGQAALEGGLFAEMPKRLAEILAAERAVRDLAFPPGGGASSDAGSSGGAAGDGGGAPVLTAPELAGAMRALEGLNNRIGASINRLLQQQQDWATVQKQHAREQALERRVMALMFTDPPRLGAAVGELRERVAGLEAAAGGGGGGEGGGGGGGGAGGAAGEAVTAALGL